MGFFDDVATNIKSAADVIGEKAGTVYDVSRLSYTAVGLKSEIKKKLKAFGESVYEKIKDGNFDAADFEVQIEELDSLYLQLDSINELIAKAKNQRICRNCGTTVGKDAEFCEHCGEKVQ